MPVIMDCLSKFTKFSVGDIVAFTTASQEVGYTTTTIKKEGVTTVKNSGESLMLPPYMAVSEIILESKPTERKVLACCNWFSMKTGKFHQRWLNASLLEKKNLANAKIPPMNEGEIVMMQTDVFESEPNKQTFSYTLEHETLETSYKVERTLGSISFTPPKMVIVSIENKKKRNTGKKVIKRLSGDKSIKCIWFNYLSNKYCESVFDSSILSVLS